MNARAWGIWIVARLLWWEEKAQLLRLHHCLAFQLTLLHHQQQQQPLFLVTILSERELFHF